MQEQIINILADATGRDTADFSDASQNLFESGLLVFFSVYKMLLAFKYQFQNLTVANGTLLKRLKNG